MQPNDIFRDAHEREYPHTRLETTPTHSRRQPIESGPPNRLTRLHPGIRVGEAIAGPHRATITFGPAANGICIVVVDPFAFPCSTHDRTLHHLTVARFRLCRF